MPAHPRTLLLYDRRAVLRQLGAAAVGLVSGGVAHGYLYERHRIGVTRQTLPVASLPTALQALRVAFVTDLHLSGLVPADDVEDAVRLVAAERADLIVLGGDYVSFHDRRFMEPCAERLAVLSAPHGVFAVLGNHDDGIEMPRALSRRGMTVLRDARTSIMINGERVELVGLDFWTRRTAQIASLLRGSVGWTVLLAHDPRRFAQATSLNVPLVLSGHTHGGQIVVPGLGALAARKFPVAEGTIQRENTTMFVSRGVGTVYVPFRINCPPEVAVLTLVRAHREA
jgi:uncharacterized protein